MRIQPVPLVVQVEPKRQALAGAQADLDATNKTLAKAQKQLAGVQEKIASLEAAFAEAMDKKAGLAKQVSDCTAKLQRADKLIGGLGGERVLFQDYKCTLASTNFPMHANTLHLEQHGYSVPLTQATQVC